MECYRKVLVINRIVYYIFNRGDKTMHIDSYKLGKIIINGKEYSSDCIVFGNSVKSNWQRKKGHLLSDNDLQSVIKNKPTVLIVGSGKSGKMKIPNETRHFLLEEEIQLEIVKTNKAVERFNELSKTGVKIAAALHLSC
ncbi:MAG: hypothetical protein FVQ84_12070 [Planctomycetes bacterium]|nr:hypothetical protein [Planctomycetota bacterium]